MSSGSAASHLVESYFFLLKGKKLLDSSNTSGRLVYD